MSFLGLDVGTTRCKACLIDETGSLLGSASREYGYSSPHPAWAEQDPEEVWSQVRQVIREAVAQSAQEPRALSISAQGEAVTFLDQEKKVLRPTLLGMDMRSTEQCDELRDRFGDRELLAMAGVPLHPITSLAKLLWVKQQQPEIFNRCRWFLCYEDYIFQKLCGRPVISRSLAAKTMLFDSRAQDWSPSVLDFLGISREQVAECVSPGEAFGIVDPSIARELGLPKDLALVAGGHDQCCCALGSGSLRETVAADSVGTAEVLSVPVREREVVLRIEPQTFSCYDHVIPGRYLLATLNQTAGLLLRWFRDQFAPETLDLERRTGKSSYGSLIQQMSDEPAHVFVLPHLVGSGTPWIDAGSRAAIVGMTLNTTRGEVIRALLESVVFEQKISMDLFEQNGVRLDEIRATGGCTRSPEWMQIRSDILGKPVKSLVFPDAGVMGAAMLAARGTGTFKSLEEAAGGMIHVKEIYEPDPGRQRFYQDRFAIYRDLYPALKNINPRIRKTFFYTDH